MRIDISDMNVRTVDERHMADNTTLAIKGEEGEVVEIEMKKHDWEYMLECFNERVLEKVSELEDQLERLSNVVCRCNTECWQTNLTSPSGE